MDNRLKAAIFAAAIVIGAPTAAQDVERNDTGVRTVTQERLARAQDNNTIWNILGALGLLGLFGLHRPSDNDSYTKDPIE
jgi:hypothetical protein